MKQPGLGKKIAELRQAKGYTQGELAQKCNLSIRTIQRIESAEVTPRAYTVKLIFSNLDYEVYDSFGKQAYKLDRTAYRLKMWLEQLYRYILDLFNLKTHTMRKVTILTLTVAVLAFGLTSLTLKPKAEKVRKIIEESNQNMMWWFNGGEIDKVASLYMEDACLVAKGCGQVYIKGYYSSQIDKYKFKELKTTSVNVSGSLAVEKGTWRIEFKNGQNLSGEYLAEWRLTNKKWLIANDLSAIVGE